MKLIPGGSAFMSCLLLTNLAAARPVDQPQDAPKLIINIVEGEGALNNIKQRVNREPIVQVEDENHKPIAGAAVVFFLPTSPPRPHRQSRPRRRHRHPSQSSDRTNADSRIGLP